jgi:hypothetical protein
LRSAVELHPIRGGFRLSEANSFSNGGAVGVSDSFASALWCIEFLLTCASFGAAGANLHGGYESSYTPVDDIRGSVIGIRPVYYGMLFLSRIVPGRMHPVVVNSELPISAFAVAGNDGATYLAIINKNPVQPIEANVILNASASYAAEVALHGPDLAALTGTTFGGGPVSLDGKWTPKVEPITRIGGRQFMVHTDPASAKLLRIT